MGEVSFKKSKYQEGAEEAGNPSSWSIAHPRMRLLSAEGQPAVWSPRPPDCALCPVAHEELSLHGELLNLFVIKFILKLFKEREQIRSLP